MPNTQATRTLEVRTRRALARLRTALNEDQTPTFVSVTLTGLTASKLVASNASKTLESIDTGASLSFDGDTLNTIQNIRTTDSPQFTGVEVGHATDTTLTRASAGDLNVEGNIIYRAGGTDVPVTDGGTGLSTLTDHGILLGSGTGAVTPLAAATNGQLPIGSTGADPVLAGITGTSNQIIVTNGAGSITLSLPQDYDTGATPTLADLTLSAPSNIYALSHDSFADFVAGEHFLQTAITNVSTALSTGILTVTTGTGALGVTTDNTSNWDAAYTHISESGASHTYIDQDVTTTGTPQHARLGIGTASVSTANIVITGTISQSASVYGIDLNSALTSSGGEVVAFDSTPTVSVSNAQNFVGFRSGCVFTTAGNSNTFDFVANGPASITGTVDNAYGFYVGAQKTTNVTNGWGVYQASANDLNYFAGDVAFGVVSPSEDVHAGDTVRADTAFNLNGTDIITSGVLIADLDALGASTADGEFLVATGAGTLAWESGATARTSIGLGAGDSPTFTGLDLTGITDSNVPYVSAAGFADSGLTYDGTNFELTGTSGFALQITGSGSNCVRMIRSDSDTTTARDIFSFEHETDGDMADGFGMKMLFRITDAAFGPSSLGHFGMVRAGSDTVGAFVFQGPAGDAAEWVRIDVTGIGVGTSASEDVHAADTVRADTFFNHNGTDGLSQTTQNPGVITSSGGIVTTASANPYADMYAYEAGSTITISASGIANKVQVTSFATDGVYENATPDNTNDHITISTAGDYFIAVSATIETTGGGGGAEYGFGVYKNNGATLFQNLHCNRTLAGGGGDSGSISMSGIATLAASDTIEVWCWNYDNTDDIVIDDITLSLIKVGT